MTPRPHSPESKGVGELVLGVCFVLVVTSVSLFGGPFASVGLKTGGIPNGILVPSRPFPSLGPAKGLSPTPSAGSSTSSGLQWVPSALPAGFPGVEGAAFASDPQKGLTVIFGGVNTTNGRVLPLNTTWVFESQTMSFLNVTGRQLRSPSARLDASLSFDPSSGIFVLFGGLNITTGAPDNDTWWFYPGNLTWREALPGGNGSPPARSGGMLAVEPQGPLLVLFGGRGYSDRNDTWTYDPSTNRWTNVSGAPSPPSLTLGTLLTLPTGLLLFGGNTSASVSNETWLWNATTLQWHLLHPVNSPPARYMAGAVSSSSLGGPLLYGGRNSTTILSDLWEWSGNNWVYLTTSPAIPRDGEVLAWPGGNWTGGFLLGGFRPPLSATQTSDTLYWGVIPPAPAPVVTVEVPSQVVVGQVWDFNASVDQASGYEITGVRVNLSYPGGSEPVSSLLGLATGNPVSGNWSASLPPAALAGNISWTLVALNNGNVSTWRNGVIRVSPTPPPPASLQGFVYDAQTSPAYPVGGARVILVGPTSLATATNSSGYYDLPAVPSGSYLLTVSASGYDDWTDPNFHMGSAPSVQDVFLYPSTSAFDLLGVVSIQGTSTRLAGVSVSAHATPSGPAQVAHTNANGSYALSVPPDLNYTVGFSLAGFHTEVENISLRGLGLLWLNVSLRPLNTTDLVVVTLTVSDARPLPGDAETATVRLNPSQGTPPGTVVDFFLFGPAGLGYDPSPPSGLNLTNGSAELTFEIPSDWRSGWNLSLWAYVQIPQVANVSASVPIGLSFPPPPPPSPWPRAIATGLTVALLGVALALLARAQRRGSGILELFLIYRGGKLVAHASPSHRAEQEAEIVTGMLEAVQKFLQQSFRGGEEGALTVMDLGERKLHIVRGSRLAVAALLEPGNVRETVRQIGLALREMEATWSAELSHWSGVPEDLPHLNEFVQALMSGYYHHHRRLRKKGIAPSSGDDRDGGRVR